MALRSALAYHNIMWADLPWGPRATATSGESPVRGLEGGGAGPGHPAAVPSICTDERAIIARGKPTQLYSDNGSAYRSEILAAGQKSLAEVHERGALGSLALRG